MPAKCKSNKRRTQHTRASFTQKLDRTPVSPRVLRKIWLPNGDQAALAECNGVFLIARFDASERPLQARPDAFGGQNGQANAYNALSILAGKRITPKAWR